MLISRERGFLFIHIQKTGGSSLARALQSRIPDLAPFLGMHDHAAWARPRLDGGWDGLFKAAFVRNPWDRLVSWYAMIQQGRGTPEPPRLWRYVLDRVSSFAEFLYRCTGVIDDYDGRKSFLYNQLDYIADETGRLLVDFVGRFEELERDAGELFARLGLAGLALPHLNRSNHADYREAYTPATRDLVAERFARDIACFGYRF